MEGPIIAEFSNLNSLNQKVFVAGGNLTERNSINHRGSVDERQSGSFSHRERLLRGESTYTAASSDGRANEHFIEDQPQALQYGMSHLLPKTQTAEERERLLRRIEMCAKAREESTKIMSIRFAERDALKHDIKQVKRKHLDKLAASQRDRDQRWTRKLQNTPFAVDLVAESQRIDEENRVRKLVEQRRARSAAARSRQAHDQIFQRATAEADELEHLRREKRLLLENERQLKALRDVEKSNARTVQILQARQQKQNANRG
eukprot:TRINITY_DN76827_c0_g1_i1.p1 TRINITY_DN76827_c0_g1~~TRINITY_DN76827_c0_g1_i1.p1  ORF type:complete len:261 (-),score=61.96 TRINITY_DN76827_c0_g1_i1:83-865(-)